MTIVRLKVTAAGSLVSIQDGGRPGLARFGVPQSGPMDRLAFAAANIAIGNPADAAGIEVSVAGLVLDCLEGSIAFALTGGGFILDHDGQQGQGWTTGILQAGQRLAIRAGHWGSWACLALAGQMHGTPWLGSLATHGPSGMGGGMLQAGQTITLSATRVRATPCLIPAPIGLRPRHILRATLGPQDRFFPARALNALQDEAFTLSSAYDRMGSRLHGPDLGPKGPLDMLSAPILRGSVQVAGDGVATVLMADHQTTGGYPRVATVLDADLDGFAQLRPGDRVRFQLVTPEQAAAIAATHRRAVDRYLKNLRKSCR